MEKRNNPEVTEEELRALCEIRSIKEGFLDSVNEEDDAPVWKYLDNVCSIAVRRNHIPGCPGSCGDVFFLFDCLPGAPIIIFKRHEKTDDSISVIYEDITGEA